MEKTRFWRRIELPGVEVLEVIDSPRPWRCFASTFELMMPASWQGEVRYRGARHGLGPGMLFCPGPGDTFEISRAAAPGSFYVLMLDPESLREALAEHGSSPEAMLFHRVVTNVPHKLLTSLAQMFSAMRHDAAPMKLQTSLVELEHSIVTHFGGAVGKGNLTMTPASKRMRELIHADFEGKLDLDTLSRETGLSRSQVVRAFKRAYGLPPHAYQLCVRIARAQRLLSAGYTPARVANDLRFVDQPHFTRHFKRLVGVTPSVYARAELFRGRHRRRETC